MDAFPVAVIVSRAAMSQVYSALPDAPVVPYVEPEPRARWVRAALADALHRTARAVAPPERSPAC